MSFDLEKARDLATNPIHCPETDEIFVDAIAEIERLRADNAGLSKAVISIQEERDLAQAEFRAYHKAWEEQAIEIERLRAELASANVELLAAGELVTQLNRAREAEIDQAGAAERIYLEGVRAKDARIKELEDALVEERAQGNRSGTGNILMSYLRDNNIDPEKYFSEKATEQLQAEGKIGPDAKPRSWQITDERRRALSEATTFLPEGYGGDTARIHNVLRDMLEASQ